MKVALRREIEHAITDFLQGSPLDADTLEQALAARKLRIAEGLDAEDETNRVVQSTLNAVDDELDGAETVRAIDPRTRERVVAIPLETAKAAIWRVWSDGE